MILLYPLLGSWLSAPATTPCQAHLEVHQQDGFLTVTGHCHSLLPTAARYRYELSMRRESAGERSHNTQRGEFSVAPAQKISLSQARVNASSRDVYHIKLRVLDLAGHTVAQHSVVQAAGR